MGYFFDNDNAEATQCVDCGAWFGNATDYLDHLVEECDPGGHGLDGYYQPPEGHRVCPSTLSVPCDDMPF